ncbi:1-acyl-sn-glycerol-3-phosphate acyltransferase [Bermanella marisrubri]|uniref:1-acyl-sn-glycerol-3-phosphate acyltransferase, putative n=1 Tax=Bermanella marisrubri TaxID=207949 RepID=Q1N191_9GAMM|nr:lysophospholipid acyltransferase family protein [Bermanella marisrubri]EAT11960.1 1-acyl-sn-glycerol-3-phosphate acyltransferase, putative [Oceanobacter sp. RED65] [Bermanella marisrubri]QIZ84764.1 1-acyl-sn-glycerol-3-phosphate acyltransferase [Bermanella marisrubri]
MRIIRCLLAPLKLLSILVLLITLLLTLIIIYLCVGNSQRRQEWMQNSKSFICQRLLSVLNIRIQRIGQADPQAKLWVANHISWLDILMFTSLKKMHFIAKSEVRSWPLVGFVTSLLGTVFIRRHNKFQVYRSLPRAQSIISKQERLFVFPEGTTSSGRKTEFFYPMMFEIAVRERTRVQPIALRYWNADDKPCDSAPFVDDDGIVGNILELARQKHTLVEVYYLPSLDGETMDRKQLAQTSQANIDRILKRQHPYYSYDDLSAFESESNPNSKYELE